MIITSQLLSCPTCLTRISRKIIHYCPSGHSSYQSTATLSKLLFAVFISFLFWTSAQAASELDKLPIRGEWIRTADTPLSPRNGATIAWTGSEVIVFGGNKFLCPAQADCIDRSNHTFFDGAAYNPVTDTWRKIADIPVGIIVIKTLNIGVDVYVLVITNINQRSISLLRYQSRLDNWHEIELPEEKTRADIAAFGRNVVLYSPINEIESAPDWLLNTETDQWTRIPDDPLGPGFSRQYMAFGDDLYLFDHALVPSPGGADGPSYLRAARFRQQQWRALPRANSIGSAPTLISGNRLISPELGCADGGETDGYGRCIAYGIIFDTSTDTWHELPDAPGLGAKNIYSSGGKSDNQLLLSKPGYPALNADTDQWFIVPELDTNRDMKRSIQAAGPYGFAFGGSRFSNGVSGELLNEAWIWMP